MRKLLFPFYKQLDSMDCGPTCLRMIAKHHGKVYSLQYLRENSFISREGVSLLGISDAAENIGLRSLSVRIPYEKLEDEVPLPCIAHWNQQHFIVIHKIKKDGIHVADPAHGLLRYSKKEFLRGWTEFGTNGDSEGTLLLLEPTPAFYKKEDEGNRNKTGFKFLYSYLFKYKKFLSQLVLGLLLGSLLQLIFPFLTQSLVDFGITNQNIGFVYTILLAQLMLFFSRASVDLIRGWILLHIGTRVNISLISDFLIKLMKLPMAFFDAKMIGDILQRIGDHRRVETFLTSTSLNILFSMINLIVFGFVLGIYSSTIFTIFFIGSIIYVCWILIFMKKRRDLDYKRFDRLSRNQGHLIQLINGMQEIKLNGCEKQKRWQWEHIQAQLFKVNVASLSVNQFQQAGTLFINELKNIMITFIAVKEVIDGNMTLGMMLAVQYIIGQLNAPIGQLLGFMQSAQDAKLSLERLGEIHDKEDEEKPEEAQISSLPGDKSLYIDRLDFQYEGPHSEYVLKDLNLNIPGGKITAVVGVSGSGKTTLLKLLLKFYTLSRGEIKLGDLNLANFSSRAWRQKCGVVMQDGFIFSDTITRNIAMADERMNKQRLIHAARVANIQEFIESLPLGYNTKIGADGHGLSQGQRQRILIARAVYKNPEYIFFDEATNALDSTNEGIIMKNLDEFFEGKTVIIIAHRLSTVKKADQIVVLEKGRAIETGTHAELTELRGAYFNLVKDQLELGS
ncbi:peptidase domain-containing ABC transporter [candidate division KSB1 bacterium]|nr:peptidase domain-containing ABC transporter [candidate division KSB1 bacterium]